MVTLCLIIFSSYGLTRFFNLSNPQDKKLSDLKNFFKGFLSRKGIPLVVVMLVCLEFIVLPTTLIKVEIPECYQKIKEMPGEFAILELPASFSGVGLIGNVYMFYQTVHEKKIVNGYLTRHSPNSMDFLKELFPEENITRDNRFRDKLAQSNVKQVIVHEYQKRLEGTLENEDTSCLVIKEKPSSIKVFQLF